MFKFVVLTAALVACVSAAPGNLIVPATPVIAAPAVALHSVPVATSYHNTYKAPVLKAAPLVVKTPIIAPATIIKTAPVFHAAPILAAPAFLKTAPVIAAPAVAVAHAPVAVATSYSNTYKAPLLKSFVATPLAVVH